MQPVPVSNFLDQLEFLVIKILGDKSHSTDKIQEFLIFLFFLLLKSKVNVCRDAVYIRQF
jgi:predicted choloylglycine hydrolase